MSKKFIFIGILVSVLLGVFFTYKHNILSLKEKLFSLSQTQNLELSYISSDPKHFSVSLFAEKISSPTRIKITPDGKYLLVSQISGEVLAFKRNGNDWEKEPTLLTTIETHFPGFPAEEGGLVGMIFSSHFTENGNLFLLYSYQDEKGITNRIDRITLEIKDEKLTAGTPKTIFTANTPGNISHQITDGVGISIKDTPHLLFLVGEGFKAERAQDVTKESGKVMIIQEDGNNPIGVRPYPKTPKIQAIGLRNGYVLAQNTYQGEEKILLTDTGPDKFDRVIYSRLFDAEGNASKPINLNWNGVEEDLQKSIPDPNLSTVKDMVLMRLPTTLTFTGLAFHPGKGAIPTSDKTKQSVLITVFGKTGSTENEPGKEIWLGQLDTTAEQPQLTTQTLVTRNPSAQATLGNPIGLEIDPKTGNFFFADIFEGNIYQVIIK